MAQKPRSASRLTDPMLTARAIPVHPLEWVFERLEDHPAYMRRKIFGCEAAYIGGKLRLVLAAGEEPWNGLLVATGREFHDALRQDWKPLQSHPVLGKWLYLSQDHPQFETIANAIVQRVYEGDARIGVEPRPRKRRLKKGSPQKPS